MKNRNSKKSIESRIAQITALAYRVTRQGKHDVFARYSGHVDFFEVRIFVGGWKAELDETNNFGIWLTTSKNTFKQLSRIRTKLNSLLAEGMR